MEQASISLKHAIFFLVLFTTFSCYNANSLAVHSSSPTAAATIKLSRMDASDKLALLSFKLQLSNDPHGALASWNDSHPFCQWPGVTCGHRHPDKVIALELESLELTGPISPSLANLTFLRRLHLPGNRLQGGIPQEFGHLFRLEYLNLSGNSLEGGIPLTLVNCSNLRNISLRSNKLQGGIPINFPPLTNLDMSNNMFRGVIPPSLGNNTAITYLDLSTNRLTGSIPPSLGMLSSVTFFDLSVNNLTGDIPASIWNLSMVTRFEVYNNNLSGTFPPDLGNRFPHLQNLLLFENQFTGPIPMSIANASGLQHFQIYNNEFSGTVPRNLGTLQKLQSLILGNNQLEAKDVLDWSFFTGLVNCTNLQKLDVGYNMLEGVLPHAIANLSKGLSWLGMDDNQISGNIPPEIENLISLSELRMKDNSLTGSIPSSIRRLQRLQTLHLSANMFSGEIPIDIGNLTLLNELRLEENSLTGSVPKTLGNCSNLLLLNLGYNHLTGTIPVEIISINSLSICLSFSHNSLTGPLPSEIGRLTSLGQLDICNNNLTGEIPSALGECLSMEYMFMEGNFFQGSIPSSFRQLKGLRELDLARNNLSGKIPEFLAGFNLDNLNLSFNNFEGEVPKDGVFAIPNVVSIQGNNNLCGGRPDLALPPCPVQPHKKERISVMLIVIIIVVGIVLIFILLGCISYFIKRSRSSLTVQSLNKSQMRITYSDLFKATDGFSAANLIGVGSFGSVYKARVENDEAEVVAVKVIDNERHGASKSFMAECEALRNIRHRNLVKILTVCSGSDFKGNDFNALVFELMPNGNLEEWLHPENHEEQKSKKLNLIQRLNIAIDVANALDYLHHHSEAPIVHCDLKPSNVLLDDDMVAHVGDFGLARFLDKNSSQASLISTSSSGLKGTIGYVAPEYGMANKVSKQGDVYSYGIVLLEMFTGKTPTDHAFTEGLSLPKFVEMAFPERLMEIVDAGMFSDEDADQSNNKTISKAIKGGQVHECLASVLRIGLSCTRELASERMHMGDVTREMMKIKATFLQIKQWRAEI